MVNLNNLLHGIWLGLNVKIGKYVEILASAQIIRNIQGDQKLNIGDETVIAAGVVVVGDIPYNAIVAGNPAKIIGYRYNNDHRVFYLTKSQGNNN